MRIEIYTRSAAASTHGDGASAHEKSSGIGPARRTRAAALAGSRGEPLALDRGMWMVVQRMLAGLGRALRPNRRRRPRAARR
jgi:hypothetical protein